MSSCFDQKGKPPADASLTEALGRTRRHWDAILHHLDRDGDGIDREWKFYGAKYGWQLKVIHKRKALLYMVPHRGSFLAATALKDAAVAALPEAKIPDDVVRTIQEAKAYPEGRPARIEVTSKAKADVVKKLVALKQST